MAGFATALLPGSGQTTTKALVELDSESQVFKIISKDANISSGAPLRVYDRILSRSGFEEMKETSTEESKIEQEDKFIFLKSTYGFEYNLASKEIKKLKLLIRHSNVNE